MILFSIYCVVDGGLVWYCKFTEIMRIRITVNTSDFDSENISSTLISAVLHYFDGVKKCNCKCIMESRGGLMSVNKRIDRVKSMYNDCAKAFLSYTKTFDMREYNNQITLLLKKYEYREDIRDLLWWFAPKV